MAQQEIRVPFTDALDRGALQYLFALVAIGGGRISVPRSIVDRIPAKATLEWSHDPATNSDVLSIVDHADRIEPS